MKIKTKNLNKHTKEFTITFDSVPSRSDYEKAEDRIRNKLRFKGAWGWGGFFSGTLTDTIIAKEIDWKTHKYL